MSYAFSAYAITKTYVCNKRHIALDINTAMSIKYKKIFKYSEPNLSLLPLQKLNRIAPGIAQENNSNSSNQWQNTLLITLTQPLDPHSQIYW